MGFLELKSITEKEIVPGYRARFVHGDNLTLAYWDVDPGAELPEHSHPHEQVANVLEGKFELTVDWRTEGAGTGPGRGHSFKYSAQRQSNHSLPAAGCLSPPA